jgi:hydrogenase expression/formation protein HypC
MCLAVPGRIVSIEGENAVVDYGGIRRTANISFVECSIGDYVLVHVGFAIQKVDEKRALESYRLLDKLSDESK